MMHLAVLFLLGLTGCFSTSFDLSGLTAEDRDSAEWAIGKWSDIGETGDGAIPRTITIHYVYDTSGWQGQYRPSIVGNDEIVFTTYFPWAHTDECHDQLDFRSAVLHELGHAFGLHHSSDPYAVMRGQGLDLCEVKREFSQTDLIQTALTKEL